MTYIGPAFGHKVYTIGNLSIRTMHSTVMKFVFQCALKTQVEQQKQYNKNKNNIRKLEIDQQEEEKTMNNIVQVQNLCEVNYMFNKAGFGLPMDEAAVIYLTMNEMAQLNKFKSIRLFNHT